MLETTSPPAARIGSVVGDQGWSTRLALGYLMVWLALGLWTWLTDAEPMAINRACIGGCAPGTAGHWLGTDGLGRDVWLQLSGGALPALGGGMLAATGALVIGYVLGAGAAVAGRGGRVVPWWWWVLFVMASTLGGFWWRYRDIGVSTWVPATAVAILLASAFVLWREPAFVRKSRWLRGGLRPDRMLLAVTEVVSSVPALLLLLALAAISLRPSLLQLVAIFIAVRWTGFAVQALQEVRGVLGAPYVEAARGGGVGTFRLLTHHVLPNAAPPLLVKAVLSVGAFIVVEGSFAFLGLGLPPDQASWGRVLAQATSVRGGWWLWLLPGIPLVGCVLALQILARRWLGEMRK